MPKKPKPVAAVAPPPPPPPAPEPPMSPIVAARDRRNENDRIEDVRRGRSSLRIARMAALGAPTATGAQLR